MTTSVPQRPAVSLDELAIENSYTSLPASFYTRLQPTPLSSPYMVCGSASAAALIGLDPAEFSRQDFIDAVSGNRTLMQSQPLAAVYSGHQFGVWAGQLGDGRAILLGEADAPGTAPPGKMELQLKGAGMTPYSRMGDGRAVLRSSIREFLCSEAMAALGVPTSRALCITGSDQRVLRETPETAAVATRMAPSFVRFGSFEHWFYQGKEDELKLLADYVISRCYPELQGHAHPYKALLGEVTRRTAEMIAWWQSVGFMHGVMNTDNMSILGLTLDYGPFGFMEAFDPRHICNHTDQQGRYAYSMQPQIGNWNCHALGQALLPLIGDVDETKETLAIYQPAFSRKMDAEETGSDEAVRDLFLDRAAFDQWAVQYRARLLQENSNDVQRRLAMHRANPKYVLRNYLAQQAIEKAQIKDFSEVQRLLGVLERPYDEQPENAHYAALPPDWASELEVSCSS
ncbi:MAG: YdiU family protein [Oxalobacteraceae bacterium]|nr:MAG: YdiU family protein [Oxalobacteraceae bacterium]